jgi:ribosome-associated translation inhibitor RaiA
MPLRISGKTVDIGDSLRTHMNERTSAIITKYFAGIPITLQELVN